MKKYPIFYNGNKYEVRFSRDLCEELSITIYQKEFIFKFPMLVRCNPEGYTLYEDDSVFKGIDILSDDYYVKLAEAAVKHAVATQKLKDDLEDDETRKIGALKRWNGVINV